MSSPNTTPLTYNGYVTQIATLAVVNTTTSGGVVVGVDAAFNNIIPQMLNYAELRIQRDLDLLPLVTSNTSYSLTTGSNLLQISTNDFVTIQTIYLNTTGTPLLPVSKEFLINVYWPGGTLGAPVFYAPYGGDALTGGQTYNNFIVGPYPNSNYALTITGSTRMPTLYATASTTGLGTTFISEYLPDLLIMASMIYISAYQRNFGRQSDDPAMAQSYESQYQALLQGAAVEEARKRFRGRDWSAEAPAPVADGTGTK